jgi:hypothetical protein
LLRRDSFHPPTKNRSAVDDVGKSGRAAVPMKFLDVCQRQGKQVAIHWHLGAERHLAKLRIEANFRAGKQFYEF